MQRALAVIFALIAGIFAITSNADAVYEEKLISALNDIEKANINGTIESVESLLGKYPNSKLGQLLMADMLAARAGSMGLVEQFSEDKRQLSGLREEIYLRWLTHTEQTPPARGQIPKNLIASSPAERYILAADAAHSRLYVYENMGASYNLVANYFMTIGREGMGKNKEGDLRTPEGVYFVTSYLPGAELPARYGPGAFPINYPNEYDKKMRHSGYGIWIHGTEPENYNRVPLASDGCVSLSNDEFEEIRQYITTDGTTPIIISRGFNWIDPGSRRSISKPAFEVISQWKKDWESLDTDRYLSHYSPRDFNNYDSFAKHKRQINQSKKFIDIELNNLSIYGYPGDHQMMIVSFDQEYRSDNHHSVTQKRQFWKQQDGQWKIIYEG